MSKIAPRISLFFWILWLIRGLLLLTSTRPSTSTLTTHDILQFLLAYCVQGAGVVLSALLCRRPNRGLAIILALLSMFALWKYFLGGPVLRMLPAFGGLSFRDALAEWWGLKASSTWVFLKEMPFAFFLLASAVFWPLYAILFRVEKPGQAG